MAHILDSTAASPQQLYIARRALRSSYSGSGGATFPVVALDSVKSEKSGEVDPGILSSLILDDYPRCRTPSTPTLPQPKL